MWQRQQRFQKVQEFVMEEDTPPEGVAPHTTFAQNMVTYAGLWNLQKCDLAGSFCQFSAVGTLPTTLRSLSLHPVYGPPELTSSAFQRFKQLESLSLSYTWEVDDGQFYCGFTLNCTLNNLYTLDLLKCPDIVCSCAPNHSIGACLPKVTKFKAKVECGQDGEDAACSLATLHRLQELHLLLVQSSDHSEGNKLQYGFVIGGDSRLVVASTQSLEDLNTRLKEMGVIIRVAPRSIVH